jgi:hypothetical protein
VYPCISAHDREVIAGNLCSMLPDDLQRGFGGSIQAYCDSSDYVFLIGFPDSDLPVGGEPASDLCAMAIYSVYELPMACRAVLGVEALALLPVEFEEHLTFLRHLAGIARAGDLLGVLLRKSTVLKGGLFFELVRRGHLDQEPIGPTSPWMMRRASAGVWSAFADGAIPDRVFQCAPSLCIVTESLVPDTSGRTYDAARPLYRGEGRSTCDDWSFESLEQVAAHLRTVGFAARSSEPFEGTVTEQILHQGYVPQGTVSLSESFDICASYATHAGQRDAGIVFTIDPERLRAHGPIWDAYATLDYQCDWFLGSDLETLTAIVSVLGLKEAGEFLARCHAGTRERVASVGGGDFAGPINWNDYLTGGLPRLLAAGLEQGPLETLHSSLELYWMRALGQFSAEDVIHTQADVEPVVEERRLPVFGYEPAFAEAERRLRSEALAPADPGWDLTAFGYIAKTCRDREFLSTGPIPPDCITGVAAVRVDGSAHRVARAEAQ